MKKFFIIAFAFISLITCVNSNPTSETYSEAIGRWIISDSLDTTNNMGIELKTDGIAQSINMATLVYTSWTLTDKANVISITGKSIGNGQIIDFTEEATIAKDIEGNTTLTIGNVVYLKE